MVENLVENTGKNCGRKVNNAQRTTAAPTRTPLLRQQRPYQENPPPPAAASAASTCNNLYTRASNVDKSAHKSPTAPQEQSNYMAWKTNYMARKTNYMARKNCGNR